jgi:prepilin-type processing-associated H-X9-DG protein/prepilin-type N-terminal cleavage/methylation domain-containing protein
MNHFAKPSSRCIRPAGFTLLEMFVVLAIVGILLTMLVPGLQAVRASSQRTHCCNNLHQIGLALLQYHNTSNSYPPGGIEPISRKWPKGRQLAWSAMLLPFIEQGALHKMVDFKKPYNSKENAEAAAQVVPLYICPTLVRDSLLSDDRAAIDYGGMYGSRIKSTNNPPNGAMIYDQPLSTRDIRDGTSATLIMGEFAWPSGAAWIDASSLMDQSGAINQAPDFEQDISSRHSGGANALFCDGHARFLDENMELKTLAAICTRAGGELAHEMNW